MAFAIIGQLCTLQLRAQLMANMAKLSDASKNMQQSCLACRAVKIQVFWTAGCIDLPGNDVADRLAKQAAFEASFLKDNESLSQSEAKAIIQKVNLLHWQRRWDNGKTGRFTYNLFPKIRTEQVSVYSVNASTKVSLCFILLLTVNVKQV